MKTLLLCRKDVEAVIDMKEIIEAVTEGYIDYQLGRVEQPPVVSVDVLKNSAETDVKCCYNSGNETMSVKIASLFNKNGVHNTLPRMMGTVLLYDATDGNVLSIMDGGLITGVRTGAAGAVSCRLLAQKNANIIAVLGAGAQARMQIKALSQIINISQIRVFSKFENELSEYKNDIETNFGITVEICDNPEKVMENAHIAISTTPSLNYMVDKSLIKPGMHIVAVGSDTPGKNEWDPKIFTLADKIVCDCISQCLERGEIRNAVIKGLITEENIYAEIGEILIGNKKGREHEEEITIFDTTGMGVQDNVTALKLYETAKEKGCGISFDFI